MYWVWISAWRFLPSPVGFLVDCVPLIGQGNPPNPYRAAMGDAQENPDPFQNPENLVQNPLEIQTQTVTQAYVCLLRMLTVKKTELPYYRD